MENGLSPSDLQAIWLTLKLASVTTVLLLLIVTPLAWWLAHSQQMVQGAGGCGRGIAAGVAAIGAGFLSAVTDWGRMAWSAN